MSLNAHFCEICAEFLRKGGKDSIQSLPMALDTISSDLARNQDLRIRMGSDDPSIWPSLHQLWDFLMHHLSADTNDPALPILIVSVARFTRNLVAGIEMNQHNAFAAEPALRNILHLYSSWSAFQATESFPATRMVVQALSNIVTTNEDLTSRLWRTYLALPEEQVVLIRLFSSPDPKTILSLLVLMVNCTHDSIKRRSLLTESRAGARICITLLDHMVLLYDADESSDGAKAFDHGYHFFAHMFDGGFVPDLYNSLAVEGEVITPHQTTLLKLLDAYLQSSQLAIRRAIGPSNSQQPLNLPQDVDLLLPKTCEALVLATQCIIKLSLLSDEERTTDPSAVDLRAIFRASTSIDGEGSAECIVELLRLLDDFVPRVYFGKAVVHHVTERTTPSPASDSGAFSYIKRDLVRLVGVLCHQDQSFQDRIRVCGGIPVIMNMCVVDERNPYLREHAILALRNLLNGNKENQDEVHSIQPSGYLDEDGVLREKAGVTLR